LSLLGNEQIKRLLEQIREAILQWRGGAVLQAFSDRKNISRRALVDEDRHLQIDLSGVISRVPEGKKVVSIDFTYDADGDLVSIDFRDEVETLFTLTFSYDAEKNLINITRS